MMPLQKFARINAMRIYIAALGITVTLGVFLGGLWAGIAIAAGPLAFLMTWAQMRQRPLLRADIVLLALITLAVMAVMNGFSHWPSASWTEWVRLASIFLTLSLFPLIPENARILLRRAFPVLFIAAIIGVLSLGIELWVGGPLMHLVNGPGAPMTGYNRGLSYTVVMAFGLLAGAVQFKRDSRLRSIGLLLGFVAVLFIATGLTDSRAAKMALLAGLGVMGSAIILPVLTMRSLAGLPVLLCAWPFIVAHIFTHHFEWLAHLPDSWRARVEIWDYMSYRIMEHPWLGWGLSTSKLLDFRQPHGGQYVFALTAAPHPHNAVTQLWVELGIPGLMLGIAFAWMVLRRISQLEHRLIPYALGAWTAALCLSLVAYNFWTDSLWGCFALTGLLFGLLNAKAASAD
jgi:O-antigen ligase